MVQMPSTGIRGRPVMAKSMLKQIQRTSYLKSRTAGHLDAARRGKLGKRLVRRSVTRRAFSVARWLR